MLTPTSLGFASPGDSDLDIDVDNLTLESVVVLDDDISLTLRGGLGTWASSDDEIVPDDDELIEDVTMDVVLVLPEGTEPAIRDWMLGHLRRWEKDGTPLRLVGAPGRPYTLLEDLSTWVMIPRSVD